MATIVNAEFNAHYDCRAMCRMRNKLGFKWWPPEKPRTARGARETSPDERSIEWEAATDRRAKGGISTLTREVHSRKAMQPIALHPPSQAEALVMAEAAP
jgi:hypothetical protein